MNKFGLGFCLFYVWLIECSALQLMNLCEPDHFLYDGILVNAVHSVKKEISLGAVNNFAIVSVDNCMDYMSKELFGQALDIKKKQ